MKAKTPQQSAMIEAFEEAGVTGRILSGRRVGTYRYQKMLQSGLIGELTVGVFLMKVERQLADWPERHERALGWFPPLEASALVAEPELAKMIRRIPRLIKGTHA